MSKFDRHQPMPARYSRTMTRDELDLLALVLAVTAALLGLPLAILEIVDKALDIRARLRRGRRRKPSGRQPRGRVK